MNRFTIYGLYQYDRTLFDDVILPTGLEREYVVNEIMKRSGDLYCYYQQPERMKNNITDWFAQQYNNFDQIVRSLNVMYEPLDNYDRTEETTREFENSGKDVTTLKANSIDCLGNISGNDITGNRVFNAVWNDYAELFPRGEETSPGDIIVLDMNSDKEQYVKWLN